MKEIAIKNFFGNIRANIKPDKKPFIIGIAGGSGSGKSFIAKKIAQEFDGLIIKIDDYYIRNHSIANKDIPEALNLDLLKRNLEELKQGKEIEKPVYTFGLKKDYKEKIKLRDVIILDGIFALNEKFIDLLNLKIFVDASEKIRLNRRIARDVKERGYTREHVLKVWNETVEPMYKKYILPQKDNADLVIDSSKEVIKK